MKKKLTENIGLKLLALVVAILFWYVVVNMNDPSITATYTVLVTLQNTSTVTDSDLVYEVLDDTDVVTVTVKAPRSVISALESSDLVVVADFDNITQMSMIPLEVYSTKNASKIESMTLSHTNLKVSLEDSSSEDFTIQVETSGSPAEGYTVGSASAVPNYVTVTGPVSVMEEITDIVAVISVENHSSTMHSNVTLKAVNANGETVSDDRLTFSQEDALVTVDFLLTKTVSLKVSTTGKCADGYYLEDVTVTPTTVTIAGSEEVLESIESIEIPEDEMDITDASSNVVKTFDITDYLPDGVQLASDEESSVEVTAVIDKLEEKTIYVPTEDINLVNTPENTRASFGDLSQISVIISGTTEDLETVSASDLTVSVDLSGLSEGTYNLTVDVVTPDDITLISTTWVDVILESTVSE